MRNQFLRSAAAVLALSFATSAHSAVVIEQSPSFVQPDENVLLDTDITLGDNVVRGTTNQTNSTVVFQSSSDALEASPQGQAKITAIGTGSGDGLNNLVFSLENLSTFTSAEFNILADVGGMVTVSALDSANMIINSLTATIGTSGENFFGFLADNSTPISSIRIDALGSTQIASIGQFRIDGISAVGAVPEPGTWAMMLFGFGALAFGMRRRRNDNVRVRFAI